MTLLAKCVLYPVTGAVLVSVVMSAALFSFDVGVLAVGAAFLTAAVCGSASYPVLLRARSVGEARFVGIATAIGINLLYPVPFSLLFTFSLSFEGASYLSELREMYPIWFAPTLLFTGWLTLPLGYILSARVWREHVAARRNCAPARSGVAPPAVRR